MFVKGSHKFSRVLPKSWTQTQLVGLGNFWSSPFLLRPEGWAATSQEHFQGCRERRCSTCAGEQGRVSQIILAEEWEVRRRTRKCWEERSGLRDLGNSLKIYCLLSSRVQHSHKCKDTGEFGSGSGFKSSNLLYSKKKNRTHSLWFSVWASLWLLRKEGNSGASWGSQAKLNPS